MDDDCSMEDSSASARERAQRLLNKNIELENGLRKAAKSKVPSDPNAWLQMRENYEDILLGDHDFSEKHEIEYALWQLHYRRIEEFRSHINAAATGSYGGKNVVRPERINKIRSVFKGFLSEATGFYHDLMLKIRSKYGLPLGYISENPETQAILEKDIKKSADMKKGMLSCHRCLIYLGDLARYKGLYGDGGDNAGRDYAAASSYYMQAASLWPSSGNPHHQLAILASYSGDEFMAIYWYFRSLAVESPFSTARDNLIIAFEKNRQSYFQLAGDAKTSTVKMTPVKGSGRGRGRGRGEAKLVAKDTNRAEANLSKEKVLSVQETYKAFCIRFVRLNGVLFTRTSLETFGDIFSCVICDLCGLLSSAMEEDLSFGSEAAENRLFFVRMISILIYSVHNANRESEGQSYAEILQRSVLLQNAFTAAFEIVGHILKRCVEFKDILSSYLSPAILVFIEWLACCPDVAAGTEVTDDKQATARSFFWTQCINFFNKLISSGYAFADRDDDETCFSNMSKYDEGEAGNSVALWEDFELRGFLPLQPAHLILDFLRKHSTTSSSGDKEKKARAERILAAGRTLVSVIRVGKQGVYYDLILKKFCIGDEPKSYPEDILADESVVMPESNGMTQGVLPMDDGKSFSPKKELYLDGEEEDEVIVFKPTVLEKPTNFDASRSSTVYEAITEGSLRNSYNNVVWTDYGSTPISAPLVSSQLRAAADVLDSSIQRSAAYAGIVPQNLSHINPTGSKWDQQLTDGIKNLSIAGNGHVASDLASQTHMSPVLSLPFSMPINVNNSSMSLGSQMGVPEGLASLRLGTVMSSGASAANSLLMDKPANSVASTYFKRNMVSRPVSRHVGPPPGFSPIPSRQITDPKSNLTLLNEQLSVADDYSWLDGYQNQASEGMGSNKFLNPMGQMHSHGASINNMSDYVLNIPFPGKQVSDLQSTSVENHRIWQDNPFESQNLYTEPQQQQQQQLQLGIDQSAAAANQYQGHSLWSSQFFV